jgi:hypothetical protein
MSKLVLSGMRSGTVSLKTVDEAGINEAILPATTGTVLVSGDRAESIDNSVTHKIKIEINGTTYYLLATTSNS